MKTNVIGLVVILGGMLSSCLPPTIIKTPETVEVKKVNYDYTPPSNADEKVGVSIILLNPNYASGFEAESEEMYVDFIDNMGVDFEEMLIAKGYSLRGPYETYDEIVYADKSETDLMLGIEIDFSYEWSQGALQVKRLVGYGGNITGYTYQVDGTLELAGKINLVIKESLTQEKLWVKSITLDQQSLAILTAKYKVSSDADGRKAISNDASYKNVMYAALDDYYQKALTMAWKHLEPEELKPLKKQVEELRSKKGY